MTPDLSAAEPHFSEPWQAQAFATTLALHQRGLFTWPEWAAALAARIALAQAEGDPDHGNTYYQHWLAALEDLLLTKGLAAGGELQRHAQAWGHAAQRTPHGQPVELLALDYEDAGAASQSSASRTQ